jgi:hypothetical protein
MGWLGDLWRTVKGAEATDLVLVPSLAIPGDPFVGEDAPAIEPDACYVELYIESLRLKTARKFATQFQGVVYSFVTLSREGEPNAQLAAISKPEKLAALDKDSVDKVITVSKQIMGAIPWRGGSLNLELGLFSVKSGNLLAPMVDFVTQVSNAAGVSFVGQVKPFLPLITKGMDLIAGQAGDTALEVALDSTLQLTKSCAYAIIASPKSELDGKKLTIDPNDRKLLLEGKPLDRAYCVFSIRRSLQKADFGEIPELKERYSALQSAIRSNDLKAARDALTAFRLTAITSPDLIPSDARRLIERATQRVTDSFPAGGISRRDAKLVESPLSEIGLYN